MSWSDTYGRARDEEGIASVFIDLDVDGSGPRADDRPPDTAEEARHGDHDRAHEQITALYADFADKLRRRVNANVNTDPATIEDACAYAWARLLERPDIDPAREDVRGWLFLTARHAAIKAHQRAHDRRRAPAPATEQLDRAAQDTTGPTTTSASRTCASSRHASSASCCWWPPATPARRSPTSPPRA